jgi:trehalose 6-phosphate synthase/phosphatase
LFVYIIRWSRDDPWEASKVVVASCSAWKEIAGWVMKHYTESTDGSYIENTESGMVWNYENTDPRLGPWQARELFDHLESLLAREPAVSVTRGERRQTVEVMPRVHHKPTAVRLSSTIDPPATNHYSFVLSHRPRLLLLLL